MAIRNFNFLLGSSRRLPDALIDAGNAPAMGGRFKRPSAAPIDRSGLTGQKVAAADAMNAETLQPKRCAMAVPGESARHENRPCPFPLGPLPTPRLFRTLQRQAGGEHSGHAADPGETDLPSVRANLVHRT